MIAVGLISDFATKVIDGLRTTPMSRVVIPPGRSEEEARRELSMAASELGYGCAQIDLSSVGRLDDLFVSLSDELGCSGSASDIDEFLDKARELYQPRV